MTTLALRLDEAAAALATGRLAVVDLGGITNVGRVLDTLSGPATVLGLYDAPEERFVLRALRRRGYAVEGRADLADLGFQVCDRDLEAELIRALGAERVEEVLDDLRELERFRAFQRQPEWRGRPTHDQLRRFAGTTSGRKHLLARSLAARLSPATTPAPLAALLEDVVAALRAPAPPAGLARVDHPTPPRRPS